MSHTVQAKQSVFLDAFGGLITQADPESLPEGSSPWCQDCDFIIGSVFTRAGLVSAYALCGSDL